MDFRDALNIRIIPDIRAETLATASSGFSRTGTPPGYFDLALDDSWDLVPSWAVGDDETLQRLKVRLWRELGEWFLDVDAGLPWYQDGKGMLGAKPHERNNIELMIRRCIMQTDGISRITSFSGIFASGSRQLDLFIQVLLDSGRTATVNVTTAEAA